MHCFLEMLRNKKSLRKQDQNQSYLTVQRIFLIFISAFMQQTKSHNEKKVQVGKDQEKAQSEKHSHSKNRDGNKLNHENTPQAEWAATKEPPQKYRLGTISNIKLLAGLNRF